MSTTLSRLRLDVGSQIGDVLIGTATAVGGSTSQFVDTVTFVHGDNTLAGRQAICTSATTQANVGVVRTVTGNTQSTSTIDVRPPFDAAPVAGDVIELYNARSGGPLIPEITRAINRAIRDAAATALVEVTHTPVAFDPDAPTYTIPAEWYGFIGAEWDHTDTTTWRTVGWRELDRIGRTVVIGPGGVTLGWLDGIDVRLRGYIVPGELASDTAETDVNAEWIVARASYHALITSAAKRTPSDANQALGMAQVFREEADRLRSLTRPRLRAFVRLGAI